MITGLKMLILTDGVPACAGCGICCHLVVELTPGIDSVPEEYVVEHDGVRCMDQHGDGACVALDRDSRLCTIYERRPKACRDFARSGPLCRAAVAKALGELAHGRGPAKGQSQGA